MRPTVETCIAIAALIMCAGISLAEQGTGGDGPALQERPKQPPAAYVNNEGIQTESESAAPDKKRHDLYKDYVGYTALKAELGDALPTGAGVRVTQVEGIPRGNGEKEGWTPDPTRRQFHGKSFLFPVVPSRHATDVAFKFYGNASMASGVTEIECFPNSVWAFEPIGFVRAGGRAFPLVSQSRIANHSWIGKPGHEANLEVLKRVDYMVATDDFIQVAGANNSPLTPDVMQCSYNAIIVGRTDAHHSTGTNSLDNPLYGPKRAKPDIVAPALFTSEASPIVCSAATMLIGFAHENGLALSHGAYTSPRSGRTIYDAECSEVIKAALMSGADRQTSNQLRRLGNITGYRRNRRHCTENGLDRRYGAGQLNVYNSYKILAGGECDSAEDSAAGGDGRGGRIGLMGFDYDPAFGGAVDSNRRASYFFTAPAGKPLVKASLAWNIKISDSRSEWDGKATLYDLDLRLYDLTWSEVLPIVTSASWVDNTENIWTELTPGNEYALSVVLPKTQDDFLWDYGLAWQIIGAQAARASRDEIHGAD